MSLVLAPLGARGATDGAAGGSPVPGIRVDANGPPPAPLADPRAPAPSPDAAWIDGHWQWNGDRYAWTPGGWAVPPGRPPWTWAPARFTRDDRGWTFHEPCWRAPGARPDRIHEPPPVAVTTSPAPPPPLLVEVPGTPPARDAVWIPGFWTWSAGRWAWACGTWSAPWPGHAWVEGHWKRAGRGFTWTAGRWRRG